METVTTKAGEYPVERKPGKWKETAGALEDVGEEIKEAIKMIEEEADAQ